MDLKIGAKNRLPITGLLGLVALLTALGPASASAAAPSKPQIGNRAISNLVQTPDGQRLAVTVPVRYHRFGGKQAGSAMLAVRMAVKLPGGAVLRGRVDRRGTGGRGANRIEHHVFFSRAQTRRLLPALKDDRQPSPPLEVSVTQRYDSNADDEADGAAQAAEMLVLPEPTAPEEGGESQAGFGHALGSDPCFYFEISSPCYNLEGSTFTSHYLFELRTVKFPDCPPVYPIATENVTMATNSKHYTSVAFSNWGEPPEVDVTIGDDNLHGHPYYYTPWEACISFG
jgi:hypothetical protein